MCGLMGWQWKPGKQPKVKAARALALTLAEQMDQRGGQSWGLYGGSLLMRGMGGLAAHVDRFYDLDSMFGHSRWATHGTNALENTHPFVKDGVVLAHNGVLSNHAELNATNEREHVVDSEHLLSHLVDAKPFSEIQGYGAVCFAMPTAPDNLYIGRLNERGVLTAWLTNMGVVWASTEEAVKAACKAAGLTVENRYPLEVGKAYFAEEGVLYEDTHFPSIRIADAPAARHWSSYTTGATGSSRGADDVWSDYLPSSGSTQPSYAYWCNKHLKSYSRCECRGSSQPHILLIQVGDGLKLAEGDVYTPGTGKWAATAEVVPSPTVPSPIAPVTDPAAGLEPGPRFPRFCSERACFKYPNHAGPHGRDEDRGSVRRGVMEDAEVHAARLEAAKEMVHDFVEMYLETAKGITPFMTMGMSKSDIMAMAIEEGFDYDEALNEALNELEEDDEADESAEAEVQAAGVQQPQTGNEPSNGGAAGPVAGRAEG